MTLSAEQQALIGNFSLGMVATIRADGGPAVSPKGTFLVMDASHIAYADIRSPATRANLARDNRTEIVFADPFARKAVRLSGHARSIAKNTEAFADLIGRWRDIWPDLAPRIAAIVVVTVVTAETILTPPYDDGVSQDELVAAYKLRYRGIYP